MSLINDALQRAKQVQGTSAAATSVSNLQLRPAERPQATPRSAALLWCWIIGLILSAAIPFAIMQSRNPKPARMEDEPAALPLPVAAPNPVISEPAAIPPVQQVVVEVVTNVPAVQIAAPAPVTRLQAIFFDASRPSAIVNGKTVFVGSRIGDFRVAAITRENVKLVSPSETNSFTLGE